jgi:hypothetical protein
LNRTTIRLTSVTYALRGQKLLEQQGIRSQVKKMVKSTKVQGCGYGLEIMGEGERAVQILQDAGIRIIDAMGEGFS